MGIYEWRVIGWLWKDKDGHNQAHCDNCNKDVQVEFRQAGEYDSYVCKECGQEVLSD